MKKEAIDYIEYMQTEINVECQARNCEKTEGAWNEDEIEFAKDLVKAGWKISSKGTLYCPACAKKHLK